MSIRIGRLHRARLASLRARQTSLLLLLLLAIANGRLVSAIPAMPHLNALLQQELPPYLLGAQDLGKTLANLQEDYARKLKDIGGPQQK